ncbi:uncharacterized protein Nmag_2589 [Natrialba magadii ATCC 43099]|uniref:Uncharacterized protein n=1 Tax=Natrialba magadii (strain ATCC 43099 / DSM 3394 / CCM 3739 / CIP 104546 / IAM 13178 / JCM 8861 / NBRC 102185 / NCIMB 2190 / MS3) TaxID=547559 RepID=D3SYV6_NATMM|nr:hypothetical protein [Natrialba magadii]ADD06148.1 uncharacterized protein Nmag_2589 [Natrialba magadii ATCC 43099]ELY30853.1 hypothetical protein C500_07443 [Natrialba magadii ATCC 43099]
MSQRPTHSPRGTDDRSTTPTLRSRRSVLSGGAAVATIAMAGCLDEQSTGGDDNDDNGSSDDDGNADDGNGDGTSRESEETQQEELEDELFAVLDAYFEAAAEGDLEAIDDVMHSLNPLNPAQWEEDGWEYQGGDGEVPSPFEGEIVTADGTVDDVLELEGAEFLFMETDLEAELADDQLALVRADEDWLEQAEAVADDDDDDSVGVDYDFEEEPEVTTWALATEDDEWRLLFMGAEEEEPPEDPTEAFEEEIIDEDQDVVAEIDWEHEQDQPEDQDDEHGHLDDVEMARVEFTDEPGIEADAVRAESTIDGGHFEVGSSWSRSWGTVTYHPEGDQIVVRIAQDGDETIVHREHYLP